MNTSHNSRLKAKHNARKHTGESSSVVKYRLSFVRVNFRQLKATAKRSGQIAKYANISSI